MAVAVVGAVVIIACWGALALTEPGKGKYYSPRRRNAAILVWRCVEAAGWLALGYLVLSWPGGVEGVWSWVQAQPTVVQVALWLFLLPWMAALWVLQTDWPQWARFALVLALAVATFVLSPRREPQGG